MIGLFLVGLVVGTPFACLLGLFFWNILVDYDEAMYSEVSSYDE